MKFSKISALALTLLGSTSAFAELTAEQTAAVAETTAAFANQQTMISANIGSILGTIGLIGIILLIASFISGRRK